MRFGMVLLFTICLFCTAEAQNQVPPTYRPIVPPQFPSQTPPPPNSTQRPPEPAGKIGTPQRQNPWDYLNSSEDLDSLMDETQQILAKQIDKNGLNNYLAEEERTLGPGGSWGKVHSRMKVILKLIDDKNAEPIK